MWRRLTLILCLLLWLPARAQSRHLDQQNLFSLTIPSGWSQVAAMEGSKLTLSDGTHRLGVFGFKNRSLHTMVNELAGRYQGAGARRTYEKQFTINEVPAVLSTWEKGKEGLVSVVLVAGDRGFLLLAEMAPGARESDAQTILNICQSFRFEFPTTAAPKPPPPPRRPQQEEIEDDQF